MIHSEDLTCTIAQTIDSFEVSWGSDFYVDMIQTVTINLSCLGWTASFGPMDAIGQEVTISYKHTNFVAGVIRSINVQDEGNGTYVYNIQAESFWNFIGMKQLGGNGYAFQTDDARMAQMLDEAGAYSWADIDPNVTWATMTTYWYGQTWLTWASSVDWYIGTTTGTSTYNFAAYDGGSQNALGLLDTMSADCRGRFYAPWPSGYLYWKSYADVVTLLEAPLFTIDGATEIIDGSLTADGSVADIYNVVTMDDGVNDPVSAAETTSIDVFGIRSLDIQTNLTVTNQATVVKIILATAAQVRSNLTGFRLQTTNWDDTRWNDFLVYCISGSIGAATLTGIPDAFGGDQNVMITGGTLIYNQSDTILDLKCQNMNEIIGPQMWTQVDVSYTWATYLPNTIWSDAA